MSLLGGMRARLRALVRRTAADDELREEIRFHIDMETEKHVRAGMTPQEARRMAVAHFGGVQNTREASRDVRRLPWIEDLVAVRQSARSLRRHYGFTAFVILSLGVAIALNTTMYGILDALIRPRIDMRSPEQLYWIRMYGDYRWRVDNRARDKAVRSTERSYEAIARFEPSFSDALIEAGQNAQEGDVAGVSANYFDVLGVRTLAGRTFQKGDEASESKPVVISERLAAGLFPSGGAPLGKTISVNGTPYVIIGVVSTTSDFPNSRTLVWKLQPFVNRGMYVRLIRLRDGVPPADMQRELDQVARRIATAAGEPPRDIAFRFHQAADPQFHYKRFHLALIAAVIAVLLIACANVVNLQLARGLARGRELALRSALGSSRGRLIAHLVNESAMLALGGLVLGLILTAWGSDVLAASIPPTVGDYIVKPQLNARVLAFAVVATVVCTMLIGLAPAIRVSRADPNDLLKRGAGTGTTRRSRRQFGALVVLEMGLALALLSGAAVMVHMAVFAERVWFGYDPQPLARGWLQLQSADSAPRPMSKLLASAVDRLRRVSAVEDAAVWSSRSVVRNMISVADAGGVRQVAAPLYNYMVVSPSYVRTMGLRIVQGRDFIEGERDQPAVIVDRIMAHTLWPNANPIGGLIKLGDARSELPYVRVVGVVAPQVDPRSNAPARERFLYPAVRQLGGTLYLPGARDSAVARGDSVLRYNLNFITRTHGDVSRMILELRRGGLRWPDVHPSGIVSMSDFLGIARARDNAAFVARMFTLFGVLALGLATLGVYGVVAYGVAERRRELGVRVALGATSKDILHAVLRETVVLALAGVALGLLLTKYGVPLLQAFALEDDFYNAPLFALVAVVLFSATAVSALVPALRATRVDPTESLRAE